MIDFMTEKEIEDLLVSETRTLTPPDGKKQVVTADRLFWTRLDLLLEANITTMDNLYRYTSMSMTECKYAFPDAFKSIVSYVDNHVK